MFPWCSADYAPADAEARVAACVAAWRDGSEYPFGIFAGGSVVVGLAAAWVGWRLVALAAAGQA
jgi:hypothetical protein